MAREEIGELMAFVLVARTQSFTRAASQLGLSPSALSHAMRALETRLGVRLLNRTTRSVSVTEAGLRLLQGVAPRLEEIAAEVASIKQLRDRPAGTVRITATDYAANTVLWPRLRPVIARYPELRIEIVTEYGLSDIVADRYDIGVRGGDQVAKDMIALRIGPDRRFVIAGSPAYLASRPKLGTPQDLVQHNCINLRLPTRGGLYAWELRKGRRQLQVRVDGQVTFSGTYQMLVAALDGAGLCFIPEDLAEPHVTSGALELVLEDWCPTSPGLHAFYASRREISKSLSVVIDALRYKTS